MAGVSSSTTKGFGLNIEVWCERAKKRMDQTARTLSIEMFERLVKRSPVRSGRFRANWQIGIDNVPVGLMTVNDPSGQLTINAGTAKIMGLKAGQKLHIVNNLPYARRLEYGYSQQAPAGMLRITVREFRSLLRKAAENAKAQVQ